MRRSLSSLAAVCIAGAVIFGTASSARGATTTVQGTFRCSYQQQVLTLVNQQRAAYGLPALTLTKVLTDVAMVRAGELPIYFSHDRPNGQECFSLIPGNYRSENIASGQTSPASVMNSWMTSTMGHRETILDTKWSYIGIGCFVRNGQYYWVQVFSDSPGNPAASETRTGDRSATVTVARDTGSRSSATISASSSGGSTSAGTYKVRFDSNFNYNKVAVQTIQRNKTTALAPIMYSAKGYVFLGWAKSPNGKVVYRNRANVYNLAAKGKSVTLYARWARATYRVAFYANGGGGKMAVQTFKYGTAAKLRANAFTRKNCVFIGWAKSPTGPIVYKNAQAVKNLVANGSTVKLYARWAKRTYRVSFSANGGRLPKGKTMAAQTFTYGRAAKLRANAFTRPGYTFAGWARSATGPVVYRNAQSVGNLTTGGAITLYAKWKKK